MGPIDNAELPAKHHHTKNSLLRGGKDKIRGGLEQIHGVVAVPAVPAGPEDRFGSVSVLDSGNGSRILPIL